MTGPRGDVDWPALRRYLQWVAAQGPQALAVTADTAEVGRLTHAEQLRVLEVAKEATGRHCIAGLTAATVAEATSRARDLRVAGADELLVFPIHGRPAETLDYHRALGEVGVPLIAFQLQPALGGVIYQPDLLRSLLGLEAVVALKEASFDRRRFQETAAVAAAAGVALLTGNDNFILDSFEWGAAGALLGFGAIVTGEQVAMIDAWSAGRAGEARAWSRRLQPLADAVFAPPVERYRARLKACLVMLGLLDSAQLRPPGDAVDEADQARLRAALRQVSAEGVPA
jgi:4-hydroxy-tetrahydrodipicolinate synthase